MKYNISINSINYKKTSPILESKVKKKNIKLILSEKELSSKEIGKFLRVVLEDLNNNSEIKSFSGKCIKKELRK